MDFRLDAAEFGALVALRTFTRSSSTGRTEFGRAEQLRGTYIERICEADDDRDRKVRPPGLDALEMRKVEIRELREGLLRRRSTTSVTADIRGYVRQHLRYPFARHRPQ